MGSLSNLYISQSYVSLIHLGSDSFITTQSVELQDGLGNGLGIFVNSLGDVNIEGDISASNIPSQIPSLGQFNAYTASTNIRLNNIETTTASLNSSVSQLNASSASQQVSINALNSATSSYVTETESGSFLITASFNNGTRNLTFTKGDNSTFAVNIPDVSGSTINTGSFATTGSNTFVGANNFSSSVDILGGLNIYNNNISIGYPKQMGDPYDTNIAISTPKIVGQSGSGNRLVISGDSMSQKGVTVLYGLGVTGSVVISPLPGMPPTGGDLDVYGTFTSSLQNGYIWVGDSTGKTTTVATSSLVTNINTGSLVTTASFNAYTQSNNQRVSSLEAATSSYVTETESGSFLITASVNVNVLTFTKGNGSTFDLTVQASGSAPAGTISSSAQITALGFVSSSITASSIITASVVDDDITFTKGDGSQFTIQISTGSYALSASYSETSSITRNVVVVARNNNASTLAAGTVVHITSAVGDNPVFTTASYDTEALSANTFGLLRYSSPSGADVEVVVNGVVTGVNTDPVLGYTAGDILYLSSSGQFTRVQPQAPNQIVALGQVLRAQQNNGSIYVSITNGWELDELHNVQINSPQTGDLLQYESASYGLWKNKSIEGAGITTTSSFNAYTQSTDVRLTNLEITSASVNTSISNLNTTTASLLIDTDNLELFSASALISISNLNSTTASLLIDTDNLELFSASALISISNLNSTTASQQISIDNLNAKTGSYATTGSNEFNGNQTITGSVYISSSATVDLRVEGQVYISSSATGGTTAPRLTVSGSAGTSTINRNSITTRNLTNSAALNPLAIFNSLIATNDEIGFTVDPVAGGVSGWTTGPTIYINNDAGDTYPAAFGFQNKANYTDGRITALNNLIVSGNIDIQNTLTASLQNGYVWVGNASGRTTTVATSSFGGAAFPYTGSAAITGSLGITGSLNGFVNTLSISSNTASLDFTKGNFFTLQLVSGSITHLTATNIIAGQTVNLLVKMASGSAAASGSLTFSSTFKFAGGIDYTPTAITASQDLVSFVTFDTTQVLAAQVKNLS